jgi:hypothetical protein
MKKTTLFLITLLSLTTIPLPALSFKYAFFYQTGDSKEPHAVDYRAITTKLATGDQLKIFLKPIQDAYIYLFYQDTTDALYLLFPALLSDFDGFYKFNKNYYIPKGEKWFILDDSTGIEKFYLIVSHQRLEKLEKVTGEYLECFYSTATTEEKLKEARQMVVEEIKTVRLARGQEETREDIVLVACDFRGMGDVYEFHAVEVETDEFYGKTIRIEHEGGKVTE